jgi:hypothetical protein
MGPVLTRLYFEIIRAGHTRARIRSQWRAAFITILAAIQV